MPGDGFPRGSRALPEPGGPPTFLTRLATPTTLCVDPGGPAGIAPTRALGVGFWGVHTIALRVMPEPGAVSRVRAGALAVYVVPGVRFGGVVRRSSASCTAAPRGRSGWLDLTPQRLTPSKQRHALPGALTTQAQRRGLTHPRLLMGRLSPKPLLFPRPLQYVVRRSIREGIISFDAEFLQCALVIDGAPSHCATIY
jgi:hypothetical protein